MGVREKRLNSASFAIRTFWQWLTRPADSLQEPSQRRKSHLLAVTLILAIPFCIGMLLGSPLGLVLVSSHFEMMLLTLGLQIVAYGINRTGYYRLSAILAIGAITLILIVIAYPDHDFVTLDVLDYLIVAVLLSSLFLSVRISILLLGLNLTVILVFSSNEAYKYTELGITSPLFLNFVISSLIILVAYSRNKLEAERQAELAEKEERFRLLLETSFEGMILCDNGFLIEANVGFARMMGYSSTAEVLGKQVQDFIVQNGSAMLDYSFVQLNVNHPLELVGCRRDGSPLPLEIVARSHYYRGRHVTIAAFRDISERKRAEIALAAEKERLAVTLQSIGDGVITTDIQGRVVLLNRVAETLTGWSQAEAAGRSLEEVFRIVAAKTNTSIENPVRKVLDTDAIVELSNHTELISKDGARYTLVDTGAPIRDYATGQTTGVVLVFRDMTVQEKMAQELQRAQKMESLAVLAGGIAHDFNNILMAMVGYINLSATRLEQGDTEGLSESLLEVENAAFRAKDLTQQLLTFAKTGTPLKKAASLENLLQESAQFILHGSNVSCQFNFPLGLWAVEIDQGQISQVVNNLVINAVHAMPQGGKLNISVENLPLPRLDPTLPLPKKDYVCIKVQDEGLGIPPDHINHIFEPYYTTKQKGNGLGLAMTFSIVQQHEGFITVESEIGRGTTFIVYLPASANRSQLIAPSKAKPVSSTLSLKGSGRLLVLDDDRRILTFLKKSLTHYGYTVDLVENGLDAIEQYRQAFFSSDPYALVLMDLTIVGGIGAKEVIASLRQFDPYIKAIVTSGYASDPTIVHYQDYGFSTSITKPFRFSELAQKIKDILDVTAIAS
jgi:PAS domain S-box-containing protein